MSTKRKHVNVLLACAAVCTAEGGKCINCTVKCQTFCIHIW